ncbi:hypothetical protein EMIHUDRAFT_194097 [Emiliania huxleyi CCMP1516]|uniref:Chromo domain-containing protein n=2 Tax=Emiliania huxleyi TaxID=2903 RepID=A0A0D3L0Y8_EMIH1|nr:hypothetical protein EMIHUDRAFT_194097 [Emiliania huxleyi CCMP1516]EOD41673.1 hypothetical protein EMIHUDRAFT_194097 [Emiliania huxleyi CCMP1516]|eukprot:XP_005794102.1 hypothetical protein EMIHUDRAFT_194097 [Emiliania huxleyi CCMP1516]
MAKRRAFVGCCARTDGCVLAAGHRGACHVAEMEEVDYVVEAIRDERERRGKLPTTEYLVKWKGWPEEDCTWELEQTLASCPLILRAWRKARKTPAPATTVAPPGMSDASGGRRSLNR